MLIKAYEQYVDKKAWSRWLVDYQYMTKDNFVSFEQFKKDLRKPKTSDKSKTEILKEMLEVELAFKGQVK